MTKRPIKAITFDLWDTIIIDETDEPKRAAAGIPPKPIARRDLVFEALNRHAPTARETVDLAYDVTDAAFRKVWHDQHVTWSVHERLGVLLAGLKRELPEDELNEIVKQHEEMEVEYRPDTVPGVHEAIKALQGKYKLGVVSDTIFSPGRCLRQIVAAEGLADAFDAWSFSDEVGRSKPAPDMFEYVAKELGVDISEIVHVGDREHNDVGGPHAIGARAVLLTVAKDRGSAESKADGICDDYAKLPLILESLEA
jgi:putative hydrolase of the HAD superfamily